MPWGSKKQAKRENNGSDDAGNYDREQTGRIEKLKAELTGLAEGEAIFGLSPECPAGLEEANLKDILAFESVGKGVSLFDGLQQHGTDLPHPENLNEFQSQRKVMEIFRALKKLHVFLIGFDEMSGRELYSKLWHQTLWEGCYVKKRDPRALTLIDVSHKMSRRDMVRFMEDLTKGAAVQ